MDSTTMNKNIFDALFFDEESNIKKINYDSSEAKNNEFLASDEEDEEKTHQDKVAKPTKTKTVGTDYPVPSPLNAGLLFLLLVVVRYIGIRHPDVLLLVTDVVILNQLMVFLGRLLVDPRFAHLIKDRKIHNSNRNKSYGRVEEVIDEREVVFNHISEKNVAKSLDYTNSCHTYRCNDHKTHKRIPGSQYNFPHSDENVGEYYNHSGVKRQNIPSPIEKTCNIPESKSSEKKNEQSVKENKYTAIPSPSPVPARSKKSTWDGKESPSEEGMRLLVNKARAKINKPPIRSPKSSSWDRSSRTPPPSPVIEQNGKTSDDWETCASGQQESDNYSDGKKEAQREYCEKKTDLPVCFQIRTCVNEDKAEPKPFIENVKILFEEELKKRVALELVDAISEIESLKHSLSTEKEKFTRYKAKFNKQKKENIKLQQKVNDNKTFMDMERTQLVHHIRVPTCGDSGGVTQDGYLCQRNSWLDWRGRCKDH